MRYARFAHLVAVLAAVVVLVSLAACAAKATPTPMSSPPAATPVPATATPGTTPVPVIATPTPVSPSMTVLPSPRTGQPPNLPLLGNSEGQGLLVRPVDPLSLQDVEGLSPFNLGPGYKIYAMSPDRRVLAATVYPSGQPEDGGELHLFDLAAWAEIATMVAVDAGMRGLVFSPDGQALYWAKPPDNNYFDAMPLDFRLYRYDIGKDKLEEVLQFPATFYPWEMRSLRSGRLAVYGVPTDKYLSKNADPVLFSGGAPHVLIVDPETGRVVSDVPLDGVKAGLYREPASNPPFSDSQEYRPGLAWDTAGERLYVAYPDSDKVTVVDLAGGKVLAQGVPGRSSLWDSVPAWFAAVAQAKQVGMTERKVVLSPDGTALYMTGTRRDTVQQADGVIYYCVVSHGGLRAISAGDLREVRKLDISADGIALSPDGKTLLLHGSTGQGGCDNNVGGLYVVDARSLEERAHLEPQAFVWLRGFSHDGRYAYVSNGGYPETSVRVLDLQSLEFVAERAVANFWNILPPVGP